MLTMLEIQSLRTILDKEEEEAKHRSSKEFFFYSEGYIYNLSIHWAYESISWYALYHCPQGECMGEDPVADSQMGLIRDIPLDVEGWMYTKLNERVNYSIEKRGNT
jgi:hypothetical protein